MDPKCGKLGSRYDHAHRVLELHAENRQWPAQSLFLRHCRAAARRESVDRPVRLCTARSGFLYAHRRVVCNVDADVVGGRVSRQRRLSIIATGSAGRARAARVHYPHLDTARYLERLYRRRLRALVESAERIFRTRHDTVACRGHGTVLELERRRTMDPPRALDAVIGLLTGALVRQHRHHSGRLAAGVPAELDQTRFHAVRPRLQMDVSTTDPLSLYPRDL